MKNLFVQFKSGHTLKREICDYVESQDYDVVVSRVDNKEAHITIFHDAVEYMCVTDDMDDKPKITDEAYKAAKDLLPKD